MTKTLTRAGLVALAVAASVLNGSPLIVPIMGLTILALVRLAEYGMAETEKALDLASARRVERLTWQLRTDAAHLALVEKRLAAADRPLMTLRDPDLFTPGYGVPLLCGVAA